MGSTHGVCTLAAAAAEAAGTLSDVQSRFTAGRYKEQVRVLEVACLPISIWLADAGDQSTKAALVITSSHW